jgi:hypothetical protein
MVTISHLVKNIIEKKPFISESLSQGLINYAALAELIKPEIEKELRKTVKNSAVMMALRRYSESSKKKLFKEVKFGKETEIIMRSDLMDLTVYKSHDSGELIKKLYNLIDVRKGDFLSLILGNNEISIITNKRNESKILGIIEKREIKSIIRDLSILTINLPEHSTHVIGLFYLLTKSLSWENITIIDMVSTWSEAGYVVKTEDASRAFKVLNKLIEENR